MQLSSESHKFMIFLTKNYTKQDNINYEDKVFKNTIKTLFNDLNNASSWANKTFDETKTHYCELSTFPKKKDFLYELERCKRVQLVVIAR